MAEEKKEVKVLREVENIEPLERIPSHKRAVTYIKDPDNDRKFPVVALIPETDEESQERYKVPLVELTKKGVIQGMYGIKDAAIKAILASNESEEVKAQQLQALGDERTFEVSKKTPAVAAETKKKASQLDLLTAEAKELGISVDDLIGAKIAQLKKGKK